MAEHMETAALALAAANVGIEEDAIPQSALRHATYLFVNWMGCVLGGFNETSVEIAHGVLAEQAGKPAATVFGRGIQVDILSAALMNSLSASGYAFNEAHRQTSIHPVGPAASAIAALSERAPVTGRQALCALLVGMETACRLGLALIGPGAGTRVGLSPTGLFGGFAAAASAAKIMRLDVPTTASALGIAAIHGGGYRNSSGSKAGNYVPGHTARDGLLAALLAERGYDCTPESLDGEMGFADCFSDPARLVGIAQDFGGFAQCGLVSAKPYPAGMWIQPVIDLALKLHARLQGETIRQVTLFVNTQGLAVTGRRHPKDRLEALTSMPHWAAAALTRGRAGVAESREDCIFDPAVMSMADRIELIADDRLASDQARATVLLDGGGIVEEIVEDCRGGPKRPMTDAEVGDKFIDQAAPVIGMDRARAFLDALWATPDCEDIAALLRSYTA